MAGGSQEVLRSDGIAMSFGDISLSLHSGEALGILCPNGAGKTTYMTLVTKALMSTLGAAHLLAGYVTRLDTAGRWQFAGGDQCTRRANRLFRSGGMSMLEIADVKAAHGQGRAVHGASLNVGPGQMVFVLGANGAGKTTMLHSTAGDHRASGGAVRLRGVEISDPSAQHRARAGLSHVPEGGRRMKARENLSPGRSILREGPRSIVAAYDAFPNLTKLDKPLAGKLSGDPRAIMLDNMSLGLSPAAVEFAYDVLKRLRDMGLALLAAKLDPRRALRIADDLIVMYEGDVTLRAKPQGTTLEALATAPFDPSERAA